MTEHVSIICWQTCISGFHGLHGSQWKYTHQIHLQNGIDTIILKVKIFTDMIIDTNYELPLSNSLSVSIMVIDFGLFESQ